MRCVIIDCTNIDTREALYDAIAKHLKTPDYCGRNLDALHDVLDDMTAAEDVTIEWRSFANLKVKLGGYADALADMLADTRATVIYN
ncbi:MAG: barstar family protein [Clostridia bacterium]|nr:barstar family protein [Clostridia bacterium]MBQ8334085.1 barstar family protein [Clostridia bacterium]MBQ8370866.1 barstar family protein [Clostridia bacterium]MBQ8513376.1 barstar family protein [Clostridia bacterium]